MTEASALDCIILSTALNVLQFAIATKNYNHHFTDLLTGCNRLGLTNSQLEVFDSEVERGPRGRNRLLGVRLPGVLYDVPCSVSLGSSSLSPLSSLSLSLLILLRLNGSWNQRSKFSLLNPSFVPEANYHKQEQAVATHTPA